MRPVRVRYASQQHLPFHFDLWQSGALLWMGSPLVDGTCTSVASLPNDNFRLWIGSTRRRAVLNIVPVLLKRKLFEHIVNDSSGGNTT